MGTKTAPTYATLNLGYLEEILYEIIGKKYNNNIKRDFIRSWKRYGKCPCGDINKLHNFPPKPTPQNKIHYGTQLKKNYYF